MPVLIFVNSKAIPVGSRKDVLKNLSQVKEETF